MGMRWVALSCALLVACQAPLKAEIGARPHRAPSRSAIIASGQPLITSNILRRTFLIQVGSKSGTAFTVDVDNRQYIVSARHGVEELANDKQLFVRHDERWEVCAIRSIWFPPGGADLALVSPASQLSPALDLGLGPYGSFVLSQAAFFLGFPYGDNMAVGAVNNGYPVPFVKHGLISGFTAAPGDSQIIFLDGFNNPGFSGGPVVVVSASNRPTVVGVVSGYRRSNEQVLLNGNPTGLTYRQNTGLVIALSIDPLVSAAKRLGTGAPIVARSE